MLGLMLAELFQPAFYDHIPGQAMLSDEGWVSEVSALESAARADTKDRNSETAVKAATDSDPTIGKRLEREWLQRLN